MAGVKTQEARAKAERHAQDWDRVLDRARTISEGAERLKKKAQNGHQYQNGKESGDKS